MEVDQDADIAEGMDDGGSSDDSSSGDEEELELEKQVAELEKTLKNNPYHYDSHVQLIGLLRQLGDLDRARQARQNMSDTFPLSEEIWLQWVRDELPLCSLPEAALQLRLLFETAVDDYLSVPIWLEFARFSVDHMSQMPEGMEYTRDVFERAIVACGLHVGGAKELWDAYTEFERAVLSSLQQMQQSDPEDSMLTQQVEAQYEKVDKLYKRQLAVPHIGMEKGFQDYQTFSEGGVVTEESLPVYMIAKKKLEQYLPFEEELASPRPPSLDSYTRYLFHLTKTKADPSLTHTLYKRAIAHHCLDTGLWRDYLSFLDTNFGKVGSVVVPGYKQSIRNCPWVVDFWMGYCRALERVKSSHEEIVAVFEKGLEGNLSEAGDYLKLWTAYCDYLRRQVPSIPTPVTSVEGVTDVEGVETADKSLVELRKTFKRARDSLDAYYGKDGDPTDSLSRYQASLEARCYGNMEEARRLWVDVMTRHGKQAQYWMEYAEIERSCGDTDSCRKVLQRAVNSASDDPELVCRALLQFERESGDLENFEGAAVRCEAQLGRVQERREKAAEKEAQKKEEIKKQRKFEKGKGKLGSKDKPFEGQSSNRKRGPPGREASDQQEQSPFKRPRVSIRVDQDQPSSKTDRQPLPSKPVKVETRGPKEARTVFVSNLSFNITEQVLRDVFSQCGPISDIRLIKTRQSNKGNVYAYVEFATPDPIPSALERDKTEVEGRPMFVSQFKEKGRSVGPSVGSRHSDSKATVYVSHIAHHVTDQELRELFEQCGNIKEVRLVKNREGRSKGFAYVEFSEESSANVAVARLNNYDLEMKRISVAISNPPRGSKVTFNPAMDSDIFSGKPGGAAERKAEFKAPTFAPRAIQGNNPIVSHRRKANIPLLPRALAKKAVGDREDPPKDSTDSSLTNVDKSRLSNDDFRKLFAKK